MKLSSARGNTAQGDLVRQYLERFTGSPKQAIARVLARDHPEVFKDVEAARASIRYYTGNKGRTMRKVLGMPEGKQVSGHQSDTFARMPEGLSDIEEFVPLPIDAGTTLVLNDLHLPFHDRTALECAVDHARKRNIDTVLLNGDILDCYATSAWQTDPRKRNAKEERKLAIQFFGWIRSKFPKARFVWKFGNHEERHERYLMVRCPELLDMPMVQLDAICSASTYGIETVRDMQPITLGNLYALHGHEYKFAISNPVNPARGLYLRAKKNGICGHFHQESSHTESDISGDITTCWSVACLCDLHPRYMPLNKWCHGFAIVTHEASGQFTVDNKRVFNGKLL
jgi:predicted phosphodiesterase